MVLTPAVIDSPRKPHTGWQKRYVVVQTYMFSQSIGPTDYQLASFTLPWLAKMRCVLLKSSVFTRKIIRTPSKPCPGWQKHHRWCQSHMFSQSIRWAGIRRLLIPYPRIHKIERGRQRRVFSQSDRLPTRLWTFRKRFKINVFGIGWVQGFRFPL